MKQRKTKDSGIPWVGQIPEGWEATKVKYDFRMNTEKLSDTTDDDYEFEYVDISSVNDLGKLNSPTRMAFREAPSRARMVVNKGDVIISTVRTYLRSIAQIDESDRYVCSTGFAVLRPQPEVNSRFAFYQIQSESVVQDIVSRSVGVSYPAISPSELASIRIVHPPANEQARIAAYLDTRCGEIDQVIAAKERQNELLRAQRTAIIREVVTRGLDSKVPLKDSGYDWLGKVPKDWIHLPLRYAIVSIMGGATPQKDNPMYWGGDIPWASSKDLKTDKLFGTEDSITKEGLESCSVSLIDAGRLILCTRSGILRHTLPACINMVPLTINQDLKSIEFRDDLRVTFVQYYFQGLNRDILTFTQKEGATVESLNMELLMKLPLYFPKISVQDSIVSHLGNRCGEIDRVAAANEGMVKKLKEYRSSLIWEAVTGKVAV